MSEHAITLEWSRTPLVDDPSDYSRAHTVTFKNHQTVGFSAAAAYRGDADRVDPEEAFVASLASCHMLTFLAIAAKAGHTIESYRDEAVGYLEKNDDGKLAIGRVDLRPQIAFAGAAPDEAELESLHEEAHRYCFIANSVKTKVRVSTSVVSSAGSSITSNRLS